MRLDNRGNIIETLIGVLVAGVIFVLIAYSFYAGITEAGGVGLFWAGLSIISKIFSIAMLLFAGLCLTGVIVIVRQLAR
jgi:hypothetical protein